MDKALSIRSSASSRVSSITGLTPPAGGDPPVVVRLLSAAALRTAG
jgi:hypothetical protein